MNRSIVSIALPSLVSLLPVSRVFGFEGGAPAGYNDSFASAGQKCTDCHEFAGDSQFGSASILGAPSNYLLDQVYDLTIRVSDSRASQVGAGFELSVETANGEQAGTLILSTDGFTRYSPFSPPGSEEAWVTHTTPGRENSIALWETLGGQAEYHLQWRSPSSDVGVITFFAAGNAVNDSLNTDGDYVYFSNSTAGFCDDSTACTDDSFDGTTCVYTPNHSICADPDFCDGVDVCDPTNANADLNGCAPSGVSPCSAPTPFCDETTNSCVECASASDCNDNVACTTDSCSAAGVCVNTEDNTLCPTDGTYCNGTESCDALSGCVSSGSPCTGGLVCIEADDSCQTCVEGADCDDGDPCTEEDSCVSAICAGTAVDGCCQTRADCDDGNDCTEDACEALTCAFTTIEGCCEANDDCDDNDPCTDDVCDDGTCANADNGECIPPAELDSDADGVTDDEDQCPATSVDSGVDEHGCSCDQLDGDSDGANDCDDQCPDTRSSDTADSDGCACIQMDDDGDGVNNCDDLCPLTASGETPDVAGCTTAQRDDDLDGVPNGSDSCTSTPIGEFPDLLGCSPSQVSTNDNSAPAPLPDEGSGASDGSSGSGSSGTACGLFGWVQVAVLCTALAVLGATTPQRRRELQHSTLRRTNV